MSASTEKELTDSEKNNPLFWQESRITGEIFSCRGDERRDLGVVEDDESRRNLINQHNLGIRVLLNNLQRVHLDSVHKKLTEAALTANTPQAALELATRFHDIYERLAPQFGYETRQDTKHFDPTSPNGQLMQAVAAEILKDYLPLGLE